MKKQYEKPEVEITMLDPELDIIRTSGDSGTDPWSYEEKQKNEVIGL